jgi:SAM-dependent methyltransferase
MTSERRWGSTRVAQAWAQGSEARNRILHAATERMLDEAGVGSGAQVLELGTGTGDVALRAADRVGPQGQVVAIDGATAALAARPNVSVRLMDASAIALDEAAFDAVIARQVLMFLDVPRALAGVRRVLRPGGRFSAVVWGALEDNPFHASILAVACAHGGWGDDRPELARAFALGKAETYLRAIEAAGLQAMAPARFGAERSYPSAAEALATVRDSPLQSAPIAELPEAEQDAAWAELEARFRSFERAGACTFPAAFLVVGGTKA